MHLTSTQLESLGVPPDCESLQTAIQEWGTSGEVTLERLIRAADLGIDLCGFSKLVLGDNDWERFVQSVRALSREYNRKTLPAIQRFVRRQEYVTRAKAQAELLGEIGGDRAEFLRGVARVLWEVIGESSPKPNVLAGMV